MKVRTEAKRTAIIKAAAELFMAQGYEGASMNALVKRLGGSKATLYGYFPSKESLFEAVVRTFATGHLAEATAGLRTGRGHNEALEVTLLRFADGMLQVVTNDTHALAVYRMVIAEAGRSDVGQLFYQSGPSECIAALAGLMAEAMERHQLRKADPTTFAIQFLALVTAESEWRFYQRNPAPLASAAIRQMSRRAVDMFLTGASMQKRDGQ